MDIPAMGAVVSVYGYPLLEPMNFDSGISGGVAKMRLATILGEISTPTNVLKIL